MLSSMAVTRSESEAASGPEILRQRVKGLMADRSMNTADLARAVGKSGPWATAFLKGRRNLPGKTVQQLADYFGVKAGDLYSPDPGTTKPTNVPGFTAVPLLRRAVAAGQPISVQDDDDIADTVAFKDEFAGRFHRPLALRVGRDQQSMMPTINPHDLVVIDQRLETRAKPNPRFIYALNLDGGATLKRAEVVDGLIVVSSDNLDKDKYPTYTRDISDIDITTIVVGEVVWIGRYIGSGRKR